MTAPDFIGTALRRERAPQARGGWPTHKHRVRNRRRHRAHNRSRQRRRQRRLTTQEST